MNGRLARGVRTGALALAMTLAQTAAGQTASCYRWTLEAAPGPPARRLHRLAYDSIRDRVVLYGGAGGGNWPDYTHFGDTWEHDGTGWAQVASGGLQPRFEHAMDFDAARGIVVLNGGANIEGPPSTHHIGGTYGWDGVSWAALTVSDPFRRHAHAMAYDSDRRRSLIFGDKHGDNDTWEWDGAAWHFMSTEGPVSRAWYALAYDAGRRRTVIFGGFDHKFDRLGDTWEWDGASWTLAATTGPGPRIGASMVYHATRARIILFGGQTDTGERNDLWEWDGSAWTELAVTGTPPSARNSYGMTYDSQRDRIVIHGGATSGPNAGDTWFLECPTACYPNCDGSKGPGGGPTLSVNDYICFQTKFALGDPYADCDGGGTLNVNDFVCFQTKFALGC